MDVKETLSKVHRIDKFAIPVLNVLAIGFIAYWFDYRYLWGTSVPLNLLMWRTNITPDNALSIVAITGIFGVLAYRFRKVKANFLLSACLTVVMTILGVFYYEYFVINLIDLPDLNYLCGALILTMVVVRYFNTRQIFRNVTRRILFYVIPVIMIPYVVWRYAQIPYGFYYVNEHLIKTPYFNDPLTHLISTVFWLTNGLILVIIISPSSFAEQPKVEQISS